MKWERYLAGMKEYGLLKFVILILALGLVIEGFFLMQLSRQQRIVLVPPGTSASAVSRAAASASPRTS